MASKALILFFLLILVNFAVPASLSRFRRGGWIPFGGSAICGCNPYPYHSFDCGCKPLQNCIGGVCTNMF
ncbi:unnamed protein product [Bursaphelenchus xylophilus]|uniref:(pine wood nematode) hypothetical protein n=1 Tax=Bursaphelenchus xylophilus TaxID=6326 RepID=A0A7I8XMI9_BURXY|nr:unnamed protein product [Bursaphelenchus xylophilus]CAG9089783.1 unnamed protein product [Bursaphelenchus xylophilus]